MTCIKYSSLKFLGMIDSNVLILFPLVVLVSSEIFENNLLEKKI